MSIFDMLEYKNGELYWTSNASVKMRGKLAGSLNNRGYRKIEINGKKYGAHQIVFALHNGYIPEVLDHINNNPSDNRIENLRAATKSENGYNRKQILSNTSGAKNVSYRQDTNKWRVDIRIDGKPFCFGSYDDFDLADLVATEARNKYHGQFKNHGDLA
jgi:hypothetical protein